MTAIEEAREQARATMSDNVKLIADAKALVESWDRKGSWTPDSPVGMVMQLADALRALLDATEPPANVTDLPKSDIPAGQMSARDETTREELPVRTRQAVQVP